MERTWNLEKNLIFQKYIPNVVSMHDIYTCILIHVLIPILKTYTLIQILIPIDKLSSHASSKKLHYVVDGNTDSIQGQNIQISDCMLFLPIWSKQLKKYVEKIVYLVIQLHVYVSIKTGKHGRKWEAWHQK